MFNPNKYADIGTQYDLYNLRFDHGIIGFLLVCELNQNVGLAKNDLRYSA